MSAESHKVSVCWDESFPMTYWHVFGYTKSTVQVCQIPVFQLTEPKCLGWQPVDVQCWPFTYQLVKINFQSPSAVVPCSCTYSFTCWLSPLQRPWWKDQIPSTCTRHHKCFWLSQHFSFGLTGFYCWFFWGRGYLLLLLLLWMLCVITVWVVTASILFYFDFFSFLCPGYLTTIYVMASSQSLC